ncbi:MAG: efflux RND transporter permease subunit, partial [Pseudomonadota bacterium]
MSDAPTQDPNQQGGDSRALRAGNGLIRLFARHPTAANLVMVLMIVAGLFSLTRINTQFFPDFGFEVITISVTWSGATAEDVDANVIQAIEPEVRFLDNIKNVNSTSYEGFAYISLEFQPESDMQRALSEVESAVAQVTTLPDEAESPIVRQFVLYETISRMVISGPYSEFALKSTAKRIRDELLNRGVDKIDLFGARDEEIIAEVDRATLRRLDLTLSDISQALRATSQDLPSGDLGGSTERQIRSLGQETTARGLEDIEIRAFDDGQRLLLRDVATVRDGFDEDQPVGLRNGNPAIELHIQRAVTADALDSA